MSSEFFVKPVILERETQGHLEFREFDKPYELNKYYADAVKKRGTPKLSVAVLSYKNLDSVKKCVECVLRFAAGVDYELVLMDNASCDNDETYNYFQSVPYKRKKVIQAHGDMGRYFSAAGGWGSLWTYCDGDYILHLNDDHYVTENAIQNMIRALDCDPSIGMVNPRSSNAWMRQDPELDFKTDEEMFEAAKRFNVYDPKKWEERIYINAVAWMFRRELLNCFLCPNPFGPEVYYDFSVRREGYRSMLLGDTWVHHNHDYTTKESYGFRGDSEDKKQQQQSMNDICRHYYHDMGFFEDICAFEHKLISLMNEPQQQSGHKAATRLLAVDVKAGQPLLDLKNRLRSSGIFSTESAAFCSDAKYYPILYTIADEVFVDRAEYINEHLGSRCFDYIIISRPINLYNEPVKLLFDLLSKLETGGTLLFKLRNAASIATLYKMLKLSDTIDSDMPYAITEDDIAKLLRESGFNIINVGAENYIINSEPDRLADEFLRLNPEAEDGKRRLFTHDYLFAVTNV